MSGVNPQCVTHAYLQKALFVLFLSVAGSFIAIVNFHAQHPHDGAVQVGMFDAANSNIGRRMGNYETELTHIRSDIQKIDRKLIRILAKMEVVK